MTLRILTFNWHEAYIHLLAKTGYAFDVVEKSKAGVYGWIRAIRPVPDNCRLIPETEALAGLGAGLYDRVIAHNPGDLLFLKGVDIPKVLIFHNKLSTEIALAGDPVDRVEYLGQLSRLFSEAGNPALVFVSAAKRDDWGLDGRIIPPGIDPADYHGFSGERPKILRIGNGLKERDVMLGYSVQERLTRGLPSTILGLNPRIAHARLPRDWDEYRGLLRSHRVYLNTTLEPYEDGYNLAMLEAMATGMPVVSTPNSTSPLENGVTGYVSQDEGELRDALETLLKDRPRAVSTGRRARESVIERFPIGEFVERWRAVLEEDPLGRRHNAVVHGPHAGDDAKPEPGLSPPGSDSSALPDYYMKERHEVAALVPDSARKILDVGCGGGHLGRLLKGRAEDREVWGVEIHPDACREAEKWLDRAFCADARQWEPPVAEGYFDAIIFADVLEHLPDPEAVLRHYLRWLNLTGSVVMSIPNVRFWEVVKNLADGYWTYQDEGLLDRDHVRFFTWAEIQRLLASCGLECGEALSNLDRRCPEAPPGETIDLRLGRITLHDLTPDELREFFTVQFLLRGVRTREHLLERAERMEEEGRGAEAFRLYADLLARNEVDGKPARRLAALATTAEEKREAATIIDACLRTRPANIDLLLASARLLDEQERVGEARQRLEQVLLFAPGHEEAKARLDGLSCCR